ncbi:MAG: hypothetical protein GX750_10500 [Clostridia bacterium]|nr:hypothetical protein [Clostridia bacterium]
MMEGDKPRDWATLKLNNAGEIPSSGGTREEGSGFLEAVYGVWFQPAATFRQLGVSGRFRWGLLLYALFLLFDQLALAAAGAPHWEHILGNWGLREAVALVFVLYPLAIGFMFGAVALVHACALLLGGKGDVRGYFAAAAFAGLPSIFIPLSRFLTFWGALSLRIPIYIWMVVLHILAIRECYQVSTARAILIGLISPVFLFLAILWLVVWAEILFPGMFQWS